MRNVILVLVAIGIGYGIGWAQFSSSTATNTFVNVVQDQVSETPAEDQQAQLQGVLDQISNSDNKSTLETLSDLSSIDSIDYTDLASLALSPTVEKVTEIIDDMNPSDVRLALNSITSLDDSELVKIGDTNTFAKRLLSAALFKSGGSDGNAAGVSFGVEVNSDNSVKAEKKTFPSNTGRIYSSFTLNEFPNQVFVKWYRDVPYKVLLFNKYKINKSQRHNYIWYNPKEWEPGLYTVEIFSIDSNLTTLAAGSYEITQ